MYADSSLGVETPEGVEFVLFPAGPLIRSCAWGIDQMIQGTLMIALTLVSDTLGSRGGVWILLILIFCLDWFYHAAWELLCRGQSPGKRIMGLRVVRSGGMPVNPGASFLRNLLRFADTFLFLYPIALVSMSGSRGFRRLGDWVADTLVVYTSQSLASPRLSGGFPKTEYPAFPVPAPLPALRGEEKRGLRLFAQRYPLLGKVRAGEIARPYAAALKGTETWDREDSPAEYLLGLAALPPGKSS
ncbi:MAG: RDD family protein [Treponema sp.]|nr:RDD family protein [Treponema sp.]